MLTGLVKRTKLEQFGKGYLDIVECEAYVRTIKLINNEEIEAILRKSAVFELIGIYLIPHYIEFKFSKVSLAKQLSLLIHQNLLEIMTI